MTANRERDEVRLSIDGKDYLLVLDIEAMCALEEMFSTPGHEVTFGEIAEKAERGSVRYVRAFWWSTLIRHQPDITLQQASDLIGKMGGLVALNRALEQVGKASAPDKRDVETAGRRAKGPRKA